MISIDEFKTSFSSGIAKPSHHLVYFGIPKFLHNIHPSRDEDLQRHCSVSHLPDKSLSTSQSKTYGPQRKLPYSDSITQDIIFGILCSGDMWERVLFQDWMHYIVDNNNYNVRYYDDYISDIQIWQYNDAGQKTNGYKLMECYPISLDTHDLDWSKTNEQLKLTVTFTYKNWDSLPEKKIY